MGMNKRDETTTPLYLDEIFVARPEDVDPDNHISAKYYVESPLGLKSAGIAIATEESIGTWTEITTTNEWVRSKLPAKLYKMEGEGESGFVYIAFPLDLFDLETSGIANVLSMVAGNLFGLSALKNVRLVDIEFPKSVVQHYRGPEFGIEGVRRLVGTTSSPRPHLGTIVKPKVGLNPEQTAKVAYEAALGGVDFIKDDETLVNQSFCPLEERVTKVMDALDRAKSETGRNVLFAVNVTGAPDKMVKLAESAIDNGANTLMLDIIILGLPTVEWFLSSYTFGVPIHMHRAMHAAFTRNPKHGISMLVISKIARMLGGDQLHTGTGAGKMGTSEERRLELKNIIDSLRNEWFGLKSVFPVASGGIHPGLVPANFEALGKDCVINAGGGIHGHPLGTRAGAAAMRQAIDACVNGIPLEEYAETHKELEVALKHWGTKALGED
ncbi:MAG: RuBisCO large subunit C-terminal-like domain-containing protein [Candidatus Methanomethylicia archaeon]|jgi:ribulose-bisphosphate carboxylase large chain|nr:RuBisCO large subunit C-terminal-like domain-containing protein [Candidatus Methanomethylicia archaeon]MCQ5373730.1 RuBisCO large subunit C-terminal-like domain-containing protein [Candidatus Methanomethylicia archaeon]